MDITHNNIQDRLFAAMAPYVERLCDPDVVATTDAAKAANVIKALYEKCVDVVKPDSEERRLSRREAVEILTAMGAVLQEKTARYGHLPPGGVSADGRDLSAPEREDVDG